jgi:hypothetical protein
MGLTRGSASLASLLRRACGAHAPAAQAMQRAAAGPAASLPALSAASACSRQASIAAAASSGGFSSGGSAPPVAAHRLSRGLSRAAAAAVDVPAADAEPLLTLADLPTSDESDELLRIRHSVSARRAAPPPLPSRRRQLFVYLRRLRCVRAPSTAPQLPPDVQLPCPPPQCAHIMAMAMQRLHPGAQCTIGPWIERGFYYDFAMPAPIADKDLPKLRKEMQRIIRKDLPIESEEVAAGEARARIAAAGEPYKLELLDSILER